MKELIAFFKDIFMLSDENSKLRIGLSQFKKDNTTAVKKVKKAVNVSKEVKLSDLMRRSAWAWKFMVNPI